MGLTSKRMKFIFKKFLDFEKAHGNEDSVDKVKEQAAKYVEKSLNGKNDDHDEENTSKLNGNTANKMQESLKKNLNL